MENKYPSSSSDSIPGKAFTGVGNIIKLLPTGTVFLFQFLSPVVTNNGHCHYVNKVLTSILLAVCGFSCAFSSFTDSFKGSDGMTHYGVVTKKGLWPAPSSESVDLSSYRLRVGDFVHAFLSVAVFAVLALLDANTVDCFYPTFESKEKILLMALPPAVGAVSGTVFTLFPNKRHGIGYPYSRDDNDNSTTTRS
ncbi:hypothetical protein SLA2020_160620 [Shorea laevis]